MKRIFLICLFMSIIVFDINVYGQHGVVTMPIVVPSSPTTHNFAVMGNIPMENSTGAFSYALPFYVINSDDNSHTISLNYHSSGVKVDELASNVGICWTMNIGGVISRVLKGKPDELSSRWYPENINLPTDVSKVKNVSSIVSPSIYDTERDWFQFNVNGISGTFYFDENLGIHIDSKEHLKIQYQVGNAIENIGYGIPSTFTITDSKGYSYIFGGSNDYMEGMRYLSTCSPQAQEYYSAWFLKEIISPNLNKINFFYQENLMNYTSGKESTLVFDRECSIITQETYEYDFYECTSSSNIKSRSLQRVTFNGGEITMLYNSNRPDNGGQSLQSIRVKSFNGDVIKKMDLLYSTSPGNNRLFLSEVSISGSDPTKKELYILDYYNKDQLPDRLTYSKDKYGYYNGSNNASPFSSSLKSDPQIQGLFLNGGGNYASSDLEVNPLYINYGMLKSIKYPSGGKSQVIYESNSSEKIVYKKSYLTKSLLYVRNCTRDNTSSAITFVSNGDDLYLTAGANLDYNATVLGCTSPQPDPIHDIYTVNVKDVTTGTDIYFFTGDYGNNVRSKIPCFPNLGSTSIYDGCPIKTINGHEYKVSMTFGSKSFNAFMGTLEISYNGVDVPQRTKVHYGGARVREIKDIDGTDTLSSRNFFYNTIDKISSDSSTIYEVYEPNYYRIVQYTKKCILGGPPVIYINNAKKITVSSSNLNLLYGNRMNAVNYEVITEVFENQNKRNGAIQRTFYNAADYRPNVIQGVETLGISFSNSGSFKFGLLKQEKIFKSEDKVFSIIKQRDYNVHFTNKELLKSWHMVQDYNLNDVVLQNDVTNISIMYYLNYLMSITNEEMIEKDFYNNNIPSVTESKSYTLTPFYNLKTITKTTSDGNSVFKKFFYASDLIGQKNYMNQLIASNIVSVPITIQEGKKINQVDKVIETLENDYDLFGTSSMARVKTLKELKNVTEPKIVFTVTKYSERGKVLEVNTENGLNTVYIWGYGDLYPIAEIKNTNYNDVVSVITQTTINNLNAVNVTETTINNAMNKLRTDKKLSNAMVTSYTYQPLVGMKSKTDAKGMTEFYEYDGMQRLRAVLDQIKNVTSSMDYHYRAN